MNKKIIAAALSLLACAAVYLALRKGPGLIPSAAAPSGFFPGGEKGLAVSTGSFGGEPFWTALAGRGRPPAEIAAVEKGLRRCVKGRFPRSGDLYALAVSSSGTLEKFSLVSGASICELDRTEGGAFSAAVSTFPVRIETKVVTGAIENSLWESLARKNLPPAVILDYAEIFAWEIDFLTEPRQGDRYAFILESGTGALGRPVYERITAARYAGGETGERAAFLYKGGYYRADGGSLKRQFLRAPLVFRRISSYFNPRRYHPILRIFRPHNGIDYAAPSGTPVSAVADGTVTFAGWKGGYGKFIEMRNGPTYITGYGHLRAFAKGLRPGKRISQGEVIGYVGSTGMATGPHLDFSIKKNGVFVNFLKLGLPAAGRLAGAELADFQAAIARFSAALEKNVPA